MSLVNSENESSKVCILSSLYLAPIEYYRQLFHAEKVIIDINENFLKQSYRNRCIIVGANGAMPLSIPVKNFENDKCFMKNVRIAEHGNWRHLHWNAIVSSYKSTPFFEYFEDDFRPFYEKKFTFLVDFNEELRKLIFSSLQLDVPIEFSENYITEETTNDFRSSIHPKITSQKKFPEYYQVFKAKNGFLPNLSIIDILFNIGLESRKYLSQLQ